MPDKKSVLKKIFGYFFFGAIALLFLVLVLWFLSYFKIVELPEFITNIFNTDKAENVDSHYYDESRLWELISSENQEVSEFSYVSLDAGNVGDFIFALNTVDDYFWYVKTQFFYEHRELNIFNSVWSGGDSVRIDEVSDYSDLTYLFENGTVTVLNNLTGERSISSGDSDRIFANIITVADVKKYIESKKSTVREACIIEYDGEKYIYINVYTEELDKTDEFYVSVDYGIVLYAMSEIASEVVFTQTTSEFQAGKATSLDMFKI